MKFRWDYVLTAVLVLCAVITTALVVRREWGAPAATAAQPLAQKPIFIDDWQSQFSHGTRFGTVDAPVQLIEFGDFECPFCATMHQTLKKLRGRYPNEISLTYIHLPLPMHRFAVPAARAAECAGEQGRSEQMYDQLFEEQQSFGLKPWSDYAVGAGVPDLATFDACIKQTNSIARVEAGQKASAQLEVHSTPTLIVNGWKLERPPTAEELERMVQAILSGKSPI